MKSLMKQRPLVSYFILAYGISWVLWVPAWLAGWWEGWPLIMLFAGIYGPSLAGLAMTGILEGKPGVKKLLARFLAWRVGFQWYLFVFLVRPVLTLTAMGIYALQGNPIGRFDPGQLPLLLLGALFAVLLGPLGEEAGWRGFALPRLQLKYSAFWSSIILGVLHWFWHAPLFWAPGGTPISGGPVTLSGVGVFLSMVTIGTFVYTWVFNHTQGNMLLAVLLHLGFNTGDGIVFGMFPDLSPDVHFQIAWALASIPGWIFVVLLVVVFGAARLSRKPVPQEPGEV